MVSVYELFSVVCNIKCAMDGGRVQDFECAVNRAVELVGLYLEENMDHKKKKRRQRNAS